MSLHDPLLPYVNAWRAARAEGRDPPARELCPDRPDLIPQLSELLADLRRAEDSSSVDIGGQLHAAGTIRPPEDKYPTGFRTPVRRRPSHPDRVGEYRLLEQLGKGGMGAVYRAEDCRDGRQVAVKLILPEAVADPTARARFLREASVQAAVESEYVIPVYEVGDANGVPYLVLPLLRGETLEDRLNREPVAPLDVLLQVAHDVAEGLAAAHAKGIVHRDIKPSNVWLEAEPAADPGARFRRCLILDFGLARATDVPLHQITANRELIGTPAYMSPERVSGDPVDGRTDLFSLGAVLYEMATGRQPFESPNPFTAMLYVLKTDPPPARSLNPALPGEVSDLITRLLAKSPDERPGTAREVAAAARALSQSLPCVEPPAATLVWPAQDTPRCDPSSGSDLGPTLDATTAATVAFLPAACPPSARWYPAVAAGVLLTTAVVGVVAWVVSRGTSERMADSDQSEHTAPSVRAAGGPIRLDPAQIPVAERWTGAPAELVGVIGSGVRQHFGGVGVIVPHPLGKWVATLSASRPIRRVSLWDPSTLAPTGTIEWDGVSLGRIAVSKDGRTLAAGELLGPTALYDVSEPVAKPVAKPLGRLPVAAVACFTFLPDGSLLTAESDGRLTVWDVSRGGPRPRRTFTLTPLDFDRLASTRVQALAVSADGSTLAINCQNVAVRLWDLSRETPTELAVLQRPGRFWIGAAFGTNGKTLYTADFTAEDPGASVRAWRLGGAGLEDAGLIARDSDASGYVEFAVSPDGRQLAVSTLRSGVLRFDLSGPAPRPLPAVDLPGEGGSGVRLAYGPDANRLYTGGTALRAWDLGGSRPAERVPFDAASRVNGAVLAADGTLVAAHADGRVRFWDLTGSAPAVGRELTASRTGTAAGRFAVSADATHVVQAGNGPGLTVWSLDTPDPAPVPFEYPDAVFDLALTPDGGHLLTSASRALTLWEWRDQGYAPQSDQRAAGGWGRCAVTPDGTWVAAVERQVGVRVFRVTGGQLQPTRLVPTGSGGVPVFSADGTRLLVVGGDVARPIQYQLTGQGWDETPVTNPDGGPGRVYEAAFLPDARSYVGFVCDDGSDDPRLEVREWGTGRVRQTVRLPGRVTGVSVAADGRHVATLNDNGTAYLFRME